MSRGSLCKKITMFCNISTHEVIFCLLAWTFEHFLSTLPKMRSTWFSRFFFLLFCFVFYSKTQALNRTLDQVKAWIESCWVLFFSVLLMKGSTQKIITGRIIKKTHTKNHFLWLKYGSQFSSWIINFIYISYCASNFSSFSLSFGGRIKLEMLHVEICNDFLAVIF